MNHSTIIDHSLAPALASLMLGPATAGASASDVLPNEQTIVAARATTCAPPHLDSNDPLSTSNFRISVIAMTGAVIGIEHASAADTTLSVKRRVFALNNQFFSAAAHVSSWPVRHQPPVE